MSIQDAVRRILWAIGENPDREGLSETPKRVEKSWLFLTQGYTQNPKDIITVFDSEGYSQMVLLKDIEFYSMCEHHMLPFFGKAHVAYIPKKKIVGISKLARIVDIYARRLQNQERLTEQIAACVADMLDPLGVAVCLEAKHFCMISRGVQKQNSTMKTNKLLGAFLKEESARNEFFSSL